jgi:hypothetical protein
MLILREDATLGTELEDQVISSIDIDPNYQNFPDLDPYKVGVRTAGLRKVYAGNNGEEPVVAVAGLDLALPTDEIFALLGQNGSGKVREASSFNVVFLCYFVILFLKPILYAIKCTKFNGTLPPRC